VAALGLNRVRQTLTLWLLESVLQTEGGHGGPPLQ